MHEWHGTRTLLSMRYLPLPKFVHWKPWKYLYVKRTHPLVYHLPELPWCYTLWGTTTYQWETRPALSDGQTSHHLNKKMWEVKDSIFIPVRCLSSLLYINQNLQFWAQTSLSFWWTKMVHRIDNEFRFIQANKCCGNHPDPLKSILQFILHSL